MHKRAITSVALISFAIVGAFATTAFAVDEKKLGKHSQDEIKNACNANGGELLGVSDSGSYGCDYGEGGPLILCNKKQDCTGYVFARTKADHQKLLGALKTTSKPPAKPDAK